MRYISVGCVPDEYTAFLYHSTGLTVSILLLHLRDDVFPPLRQLVRLQDGLLYVLGGFIQRSLEAKRCFHRRCGGLRAGSSHEKQRKRLRNCGIMYP